MRKYLAFVLFFACAGLVAFPATGMAQPSAHGSQTTRDAILVLDASGSMWARMNGKPQIVVAKHVILNLLDDLSANYRLGLMAYGHRRKGDCSDIEMLVPVGGGRDAIRRAIKDISPKGMTPMTQAVINAAEKLKYTENQATVILVSDGKESCGMDPCAAAKRLEELGVDLTVHAIGFGMEKGSKGLKQVQCFADATGGQFFPANNAQQLTEALAQVSQAKPEPPAKVDVHLQATNQKGGPVIEQGLIWTVRHGATGEVLYQSKSPEGSIVVKLPRGVHDVSVLRVSDEASAEGEIETGTNGTTVTLPIVVKLKASLKAPATAPAGSEIRVIWDGPEHQGDLIAVTKPDTEPGPYHYINAAETNEGNPLDLRLPDEPGDYELRYISGANYSILARKPIKATPVQATLKAPASAAAGSVIEITWTGPDYDGDLIAVTRPDKEPGVYHYVNAVETSAGSPVELRLPDEPGQYQLRYILGQSSAILARKPIKATQVKAKLNAPASAAAGSVIKITWTGPDYDSDLIAVTRPDTEPGVYHYINAVDTREGNPVELRLPDDPGQYQLRYILGQSSAILTRKPIKATPVQATLKAPSSAPAGSEIEITWTGPDYAGDLIAVTRPDKEPGVYHYIHAVDTREGNPVTLPLPKKPGTYQLRYILGQSSSILARKPIQVTRPKAIQRGIDRPGSDYRHFALNGAGPKACLKACREDSRCRAWAWTQPGLRLQSDDSLCWLKDSVPEPRHVQGAVSGVVRP